MISWVYWMVEAFIWRSRCDALQAQVVELEAALKQARLNEATVRRAHIAHLTGHRHSDASREQASTHPEGR